MNTTNAPSPGAPAAGEGTQTGAELSYGSSSSTPAPPAAVVQVAGGVSNPRPVMFGEAATGRARPRLNEVMT